MKHQLTFQGEKDLDHLRSVVNLFDNRIQLDCWEQSPSLIGEVELKQTIRWFRLNFLYDSLPEYSRLLIDFFNQYYLDESSSVIKY
jgi:hypothetical protein